MNKPNTKDLRLLANEYFDGRFDSQDVKNILTQCADFIDFLEGKHICEWPEWLTKKRLHDLCGMDGSYRSLEEEQFNALIALAAIAPEAPKKRMVEICKDDTDGSLYVRECGPNYGTLFRKVGECEIDE